MGGDGNRLYFYNPVQFITNVSLYAIDPEGKGNIEQRHAYLIYVGMIALIKRFVHSPHTIINIWNGLKLSIGFLSIYFILKELIQRDKKQGKQRVSVEFSAIIGGTFYVLATGSQNLIFFWVKALHSHDQIFLNPLIFFLLLKYLLTERRIYLLCFFLVSFLFSTNFALISAPPLFAFYPLVLVFLLLYIICVRKRKIPIKSFIFSLFLFVGLQSFHLFPEILNIFDTRSVTNSILFKESITGGVNFFQAIHGEGKAVLSFLVPPPVQSLRWSSFVVPIIIIVSFLIERKKNISILLTSAFFFLSFFLISANITNAGYELYKRLFYIPGFSMFRHFFAQWAFVYLFFYSLLFGQSLFIILRRCKPRYTKIFGVSIFIFLVIGYRPFLTGKLVDAIQWGSNNVKTAMIIDPRYEETLQFIRMLPDEGKILMLPLTDNFNQVVYGLNDAAYVGPSSISILTSKRSFSGYQIFYPNPIPEIIMRLSREKKYEALSQIFSLFNIRYIFHNTDPKVYEEKFPNFPNSYMMTSLPKTQAEYKEFVKKFPVRQIYVNGPFQMFEFDEKVYRPEVYIPDSIYQSDMLQEIEDKNVSFRSAFIDPADCKQSKIISDFCNAKYELPNIGLSTTKVNPTRYTIRVKQSDSSTTFLLVFQNSYHKGWKLSIDQNPFLGEEKHVLVNKYANAWIITEADHKGKTEYTVSLNLETQKYFLYGLWITGFSLVVFMGYVVKTILCKSKL